MEDLKYIGKNRGQLSTKSQKGAQQIYRDEREITKYRGQNLSPTDIQG